MKRSRQAAKSIHSRMETLESRICMSANFQFSKIAQTGDSVLTENGQTALVSLSDSPSINRRGKVAFVGRFAVGDGIIVGNGVDLKDINPTFSGESNRSFGRFVQINDADRVIAIDRSSGSPARFEVRSWYANTPDTWTTIATAGFTQSPVNDRFDAILAAPALDNEGDAVFPVLDDTTVQMRYHVNDANVNVDSQLGDDLLTPQSLRPAAADDGKVVFREGNQATSPIVMYDTASPNGRFVIASSKNFVALGSSPGISSDGTTVTFYGVLTDQGATAITAANGSRVAAPLLPGPGIFASVEVAGARYIIELAVVGTRTDATHFLGAISPDTKVSVETQTDGDLNVVFLGSSTTDTGSSEAIFESSLLQFDGSSTGQPLLLKGPLINVVEVGQVADGFAIADLNVYDSLNSKGQIAFWASSPAGQQRIFMATPPSKAIDKSTFLDAYAGSFKVELNPAQAQGLLTILAYMDNDPNFSTATDVKAFAYMLATTKRETGSEYIPVTERGARSYFNKYEPGTRKGSELGNTVAGDGYRYRGRGYVQITGRSNYTRYKIQDNPDSALDPAVAYHIMSDGMRNGVFTGKKLSDYITSTSADYYHARRIINGLDHAQEIADDAETFESMLDDSVVSR